MKRFLETGKIVGAHGVHGEMRVEPWCDSPRFLQEVKRLYFDEGAVEAPVATRRVHKSMLLMTLAGVTALEQAEALRGKILYLNRADVSLEEGAYFVQDLIGLFVLDADTGEQYGKIAHVFQTGANDVYEVVDDRGEKYLFPAVRHMIEETNPCAGWIKVCPIPGIFDNGGETDAR